MSLLKVVDVVVVMNDCRSSERQATGHSASGRTIDIDLAREREGVVGGAG